MQVKDRIRRPARTPVFGTSGLPSPFFHLTPVEVKLQFTLFGHGESDRLVDCPKFWKVMVNLKFYIEREKNKIRGGDSYGNN